MTILSQFERFGGPAPPNSLHSSKRGVKVGPDSEQLPVLPVRLDRTHPVVKPNIFSKHNHINYVAKL